MARNRICRHPSCDMPVLLGYDRCPRHLQDIDAMLVEEPTAAKLAPVYARFYEDFEEAEEARAYELAEDGYEVASWYTDEQGTGHFHMVRAD